ncbi:MAG TPA: thymidylate synthase [Bacilli bacterium]
MSKADIIFKQNLEEILKQEWEVDNRAIWKDGSKVFTKRIIGIVNKYDLSEEFPILTLRPIWLKGVIDEILWIFQKRSNNIKDLNSSIWNDWANKEGSIGKAYGYQINKPMLGYPSQIDYVLNTIKNNPTSRRIMMNMFNVEDMPHKNLIECAYGVHFSVKDGKLHTSLIQRSGDFITAACPGGWNVVGYAILTHMIAIHCGLEVGTLTHFIQDLHIYNKHEELAYELLNREPRQAPKLIINPKINNFYDFNVDDFRLENYFPHPQIKIEIAI